jgi:hypothetical protein
MPVKYLIINALERSCEAVDKLPRWTRPLVGSWIGCPRGLASWSCALADRWHLAY